MEMYQSPQLQTIVFVFLELGITKLTNLRSNKDMWKIITDGCDVAQQKRLPLSAEPAVEGIEEGAFGSM